MRRLKKSFVIIVGMLLFNNLFSMQVVSQVEVDKLQHKIEEMKMEQIFKLLAELKATEALSRVNNVGGGQDILKFLLFFYASSLITVAATIVAINNGTMDQIAGTKMMDQFLNGIAGNRVGTMQAGFKRERLGQDFYGNDLAQICAVILYVIGIWGGTFVLFKLLDALIGSLRGDFALDKESTKKLTKIEKLFQQALELKKIGLNQQVQNPVTA